MKRISVATSEFSGRDFLELLLFAKFSTIASFIIGHPLPGGFKILAKDILNQRQEICL
jgi:hypothetical protein